MAAPHDTDQLPLQGVVLCCTSLAQDVRTQVADMAINMGAIHHLDLTANVTHLLVGSITTPKYRYVAKDRPDIKVLTPDFILRVRDVWIEGGEVDVRYFEEQCRAKTFAGLEMCITGLTDPVERKDIEKNCVEQGARWSADLTRQVTHLIAAKPEGAKYTHAKQWGIAVVGLKWYEDSLMRGMALDESYYACEMPREEQGVGAFRTTAKRPSPGKRNREDDQVTAVGEEQGRKKLRKSASMRLGGQSQDLWQSISQHEIQIDNTVVDVWNETNDESQTLRDSIAPRAQPRYAESTDLVKQNNMEEPRGLFSGLYVTIHGFDATKTERLRTVMTSNGATVVDSPAELERVSAQPFSRSRCLLMPHALPTELPIVPNGTIRVTEWWVERCLHFKQQLDPDQDSLSQPLQDTQIDAFAGLAIASTGFNSVDLRMSAETVNLMGASYQEELCPSTSVLICASETMKKEKAFYASKHKIPVVRPEWLWESLRTRSKASIERYKLDLSSYDFSHFSQSMSSPAPSDNVPVRGTRDGSVRGEELMHPKRLSNTRKRQHTPSLILKPTEPGSLAPAKSRPIRAPFVIEDDDEDEEPTEPASLVPDDPPMPQLMSSRASQPLREISSNASQGSYQYGKDDKPDDKTRSISPPKSPRRDSPAKEAQKFTSDLAALVRHRTSSGQETAIEPQKRKHRPLGRNLSGTSLTNLHTRNASASPAIIEEGCEADGYVPSREPAPLPPGTQLGYDDSPEAQAARIQRSKKMGVAVEETGGTRIASMGTVRDSEVLMKPSAMGAAGAAGGRSRTRAKSKR